MTPQESQALQTLLSQLTQIRGVPKDPEADRMIAQAVSQQPDAAYLLVQRAMILEQALDAAKQQISELQRQVQSSRASGNNSSFLDANAWGHHATTRSVTETSVTGNPLPNTGSWSNREPVQFAPRAQPATGFLGGGAGSMLGTLAATAAGVAGGAFLFQGIGNLLGNQHHDDASRHLADNAAAPDAAPAAVTGNESVAPELVPSDERLESLNNASVDDNLAGDDSLASDGGSNDGSYDV